MKTTSLDVQKFLTDHLQSEISNVEPVGEGAWSQAFFFKSGDQNKVVRFSDLDEDFKRDRFASRFSSARLPVPKIEEIGRAFGGYFAISPRVDGKMIDYLDAAEMQQAVPALVELLHALRDVDTSKTHGFGGLDTDGNGTSSSWKEFLTHIPDDSPSSRTHGWKENLARNKEANRIYQQARQKLIDTVQVCPEARHLVHNDLLHFNLLMKDNKVTGVIDWGCALYGDFLYDLAMFTTWQFYYPAMHGIDFIKEAKQYFTGLGIELPNLEERIQCYQIYLLLDSLAYNAFTGNQENLELTVKRLKELI